MVNVLGLVGVKVSIVTQNCCCSRKASTVIRKPTSVAVFCEAEFTRKARRWLVDPRLEGSCLFYHFSLSKLHVGI